MVNGAAQQGLRAAAMLVQYMRRFTAPSTLRYQIRGPQMMLVRPWSLWQLTCKKACCS